MEIDKIKKRYQGDGFDVTEELEELLKKAGLP